MCGVHRSRSAHRLPDLTEVADIVRDYDASCEPRLFKAPLVKKLERNVLADNVAVVDKKENLLTQLRAVGFT